MTYITSHGGALMAGPLGDMLPGKTRSEFGSIVSGTQHHAPKPNQTKSLAKRSQNS